MSNVFIVGGSGQVARHVIKNAQAKEWTIRALYRNKSQELEIKELGANPILGDITALTVNELANLMTGSDYIIFSAGAGGKGDQALTNQVDGDGLKKSVLAAEQANIEHFILVSAFPEAGRTSDLGDKFENYMRVKKNSEYDLTQSKLKWVILRPGQLTDENGTGQVKLGYALPSGNNPVSREDVASTLIALVEEPKIYHKIIELTQGELNIKQALEIFK